MRKSELIAAMDRHMEITREALQLIWDNTNKGQRKKMLKNEAIAALLARYEINKED